MPDRPEPQVDLHRQVQAAITTHDLQGAGSVADVLAAVVRHRGRPGELQARPAASEVGEVFGLCLPYPDRDVILFRTGAGADHELHSTLHECGHLLLDHVAPAREPAPTTRLEALLPDLDPDLIAGVLARSAYADEQERQAETFAMLVRAGIIDAQRRRGDDVLTRFDDVLG